MAQTIRCDVCGKLFSSSYIGSHKRLAHPNEETAVQSILSLFKNLSQKSKTKVLENLASMARHLCVAAYLVSEIAEMLP
jgi:DNA-directed RNA polymerase subunit N (RpoN/RPB10)